MITFFLKTYGCQANVADSEGIARFLTELGCQHVGRAQAADLIIINTCAIRDKAEQKLYSHIGQLAEMKKNRPYMKIGIIGCVASYRKHEIYTGFDHINFVYGARDEASILQAYLADLVTQIETKKQLFLQNPQSIHIWGRQDRDIKKIVEKRSLFKSSLYVAKAQSISELSLQEQCSGTTSPSLALGEMRRSFINIMTGCNKYCSYCIVPFTRGKEISYSMKEILAAVEKELALGSREITLVGQNVNSYKDPETEARFPVLLEKVALIPGNFWIRFISPHPQDMTRDLFEIMAQYRPKVTASLHFPLQSGADRILALMNRNYSAAEYWEKITWIHHYLPDATISTDIIVGFPSETEEDFQGTMDLVERVRFDLIYSFIYSPRKYTKASLMEDTCSLKEKNRRLDILQKRQTEIAVERNSLNIGKTLKVLVEKRLAHGKLLARSEGNIRVLIDSNDDLIGRFVDVSIISTGPANMVGQLDH